ncbi:CHAP domain-containing protein [Streptococcus acidominimus]|uniref:CHAP domain-containing protein n=1 Tax=Streptococcus acidominimus TaxID=1326 RepID=A0A4Y9FRL1_STRAI|nr:CHAP domain-containing protein [Streptococcus acidominimus]MBF0817877.1 CHAP domain-containing protein [Streptococcus acidominimus]MBF0838393.1 CHAP domain-containing protein [Streptococcus acidominimus]MBF0846244.1 CHAP domain-containing protein [Streptococcus danieliae]TFU31865.1 CHAP domain-containing protein [Streptococcus acidominimus]
MKKKQRRLRWFNWLSLLFSFFPLFIPILLLVLLNTNNHKQGSSGENYTENWSTGDPYTHNLFVKRYGITAEQLDGYLTSTGITYDSSRINGKRLLEWERMSGVDVRAIVAMAQMESSFGTAGVARNEGANMFGYGAFDSNPDNANNFNDQVAVVQLAEVTLKGNKNETFKIQDDKAKKYANGTLNVSVEGGVYFTDITGSGRRRADVMKRVDDWINAHGGTPKPPTSIVTGNGSTSLGVLSVAVPAGYRLDKPINTASYIAQSYPYGQCTWFVFNRAREFGISFDPYMGNGGDWKSKVGYTITNTPTKHAAVSFSPGEANADLTYGHVSFVEEVKADGTVLISECNVQGLGVISYRILDSVSAKTFVYVIGK